MNLIPSRACMRPASTGTRTTTTTRRKLTTTTMTKVVPVHEVKEFLLDDEDPLKDFRPLTEALVYAWIDNSWEVMLKQDVARVRVLLKESFSGIPLDEHGHWQSSLAQKVDQSHTHYAIAMGMMLGIRECVGGVDGLREADLDEEDWNTPHYILQECRRNRKYWFTDYQFKAYAPLIFSRIRSLFGIDKQLFLHSICGNFSYREFLSNAKSGSFFFFSHDGKYLIKTLTLDECHFLQSILPKYYHFLSRNPHSFLTHFYGLYRLTTANQIIYFTIMRSILDTPNKISKTYDLKGSTLGRKAKKNETVFKDLDIIGENRKLKVGPFAKERLLKQIKRDASFLSKLGIMDYSFLLGIHERQDNETGSSEENKESDDEEEDDDEVLRFRRAYEQEDQIVDWAHLSWARPDVEDASVNTSLVDGGSTTPSSIPSIIWNPSDRSSMDEDGPCPFSTRDDCGIESSTLDEVYYCGIIDILQNYNARKWGETVVKKVQGNTEQEISCVAPDAYQHRFVEFLSSLME